MGSGRGAKILNIFRLHTGSCKAERYDRSYRRCRGPIHAEGMLGGEMVREGLKTANWQRATQIINEAEARGTCNSGRVPSAPPVIDAIGAFIDDTESRLRSTSLKNIWSYSNVNERPLLIPPSIHRHSLKLAPRAA